MGFFDEINRFFLSSELAVPFKATLLGNGAIYFEGIKSVKSFSKERIELLIKKGEIIIEGEELCIKKYFALDLAITGKIKNISIK